MKNRLKWNRALCSGRHFLSPSLLQFQQFPHCHSFSSSFWPWHCVFVFCFFLAGGGHLFSKFGNFYRQVLRGSALTLTLALSQSLVSARKQFETESKRLWGWEKQIVRVGLKKKKKRTLNMVCSQSIVNQQGRPELALQNEYSTNFMSVWGSTHNELTLGCSLTTRAEQAKRAGQVYSTAFQ